MSGGRRAGIPNFKKNIVINIVGAHLPVSSDDWKECCEAYQAATSELLLRDNADFKRYFWEKCCNKGKKPTGSSGADDSVCRAQNIYQQILNKIKEVNDLK